MLDSLVLPKLGLEAFTNVCVVYFHATSFTNFSENILNEDKKNC